MPRVEIKSFDGSAASYLTFMAVFDEIVGNVNITDQAKLTRLLQYTTGDARNAIECCALIGGVQGYVEARRILKERFGDSYIISTALINKLKQNIDVRTPSALRTLADELNSAKIVLKSLKMYSELDNQHHIKEIGSRLSSHLWDSWRDRVFSIKRKHARYATFDEFVDYVSEKADEANDPVYGLTRNANPQGRNHTPVDPKNTTSLNSVTSGDVQNKSCVICDDQHPVFLCKDFKSMSIPDRKDAVNKFKLCVNCLKSGHTVTECYRPSFCRHPNCSSKHNILLHENVVVGNTIDEVQLGPRYEGQLNPMAEPIPHEVRPLVRTHVYHPYQARTDRQRPIVEFNRRGRVFAPFCGCSLKSRECYNHGPRMASS